MKSLHLGVPNERLPKYPPGNCNQTWPLSKPQKLQQETGVAWQGDQLPVLPWPPRPKINMSPKKGLGFRVSSFKEHFIFQPVDFQDSTWILRDVTSFYSLEYLDPKLGEQKKCSIEFSPKAQKWVIYLVFFGIDAATSKSASHIFSHWLRIAKYDGIHHLLIESWGMC